MSTNVYPLSLDALDTTARSSLSSALTNIIIDSDAGNSSLLVVNNSNNSMYIDKYSNISINHVAPAAQFDINSDNGACLLLRYNETSNLSTFYMSRGGNLSINASGGEINTTSILKTTSTTGSTSISTGALVVSGGVGIGENLYVEGNLIINGTTNITASAGNMFNDNVVIINNGASSVGNDGGFMINRFQSSNNDGTGDVVSDTAKYSSTVTDATTNTFVLASGASAADDYYKNWWIKITSNDASNNVRKITGYVGSTRTATISSNFSSVPIAASTINLYNKTYPLIAWQESSNKFIATFTTTESNVLNIIDYADMLVNGLSISSTLTIGSTSLSETDMGKIVSITNGTAAASKAIVLDSSRNIATIRNITSDGILTLQNVTDSSSTSTGSVIISGGVSIAKNLYVGTNTRLGGTTINYLSSDGGAKSEAILKIVGTVLNNTATTGLDSGYRCGCYFGPPTLTSTNAITTLYAATCRIDGPPIAGTNQTIQNSYSLFVSSGNSIFFGNIAIGYQGVGVNNIFCPLQFAPATSDKILCLYGTGTDATDLFIGFGTGDGGTLKYQATTHIFYANSKGNTKGTEAVRISSDGYVGIGVNNPTIPLQISGYYDYAGAGMAATWFISASTVLSHSSAFSSSWYVSIKASHGIVIGGTFASYSDRRLKKDIVYYDEIQNNRIINGIRNLDICSFAFKETEEQCLGLIAQDAIKCDLCEIVKLMPEDNLPAEGEYDIENVKLTIDYTKIGVMLIPVCQKLMKDNEQLQSSNEQLQSDVSTLNVQLANVLSRLNALEQS